ncbi:MAG: 8-oxoguanine DNA glycosylase [Tissierellia bacterium]|nr:8-oxoguanine DNA glycosylase [Tissierellia bacterium]
MRGEDLAGAAAEFFDLGAHYPSLEEFPELAPWRETAQWLRMLRQDPWETVVAFLLSSNNHMKRIQRSIWKLSENYGPLLAEAGGLALHGLPSPEVLAALDPSELRELGAGYRDKYLVGSAQIIASGALSLEELDQLSYDEAHRRLKELPGVGDKVADCILLFGYHKMEAFPVDVWVERVMREVYPREDFKNRKAIAAFGRERFGPYSGYFQQLLFTGRREMKG